MQHTLSMHDRFMARRIIRVESPTEAWFSTKRVMTLRILVRLLDLLILATVIGAVVVFWTGGFKTEVLGMGVSAEHTGPILRNFMLLFLLRVLLGSGIRNFLLLVASLIISLGVAELALRLWNPPLAQPRLVQIHRPSPTYDWELIPDSAGVGGLGETIRINAHGMRDRELSREKPAGGWRVAVLGDSFTFGMSVDLEDTYGKRLENLLRSRVTTTEVLNFGVIGYGLWQFRIQLEQQVMPWEPDVVVLGLFLDDIVQSIPPSQQGKPGWTGHNPFARNARKQASAFYLVNTLRNLEKLLETRYRYRRGHGYLEGIDKRKQELARERSQHAYSKAQYGTLPGAYYLRFSEGLEAMGDWAAAQGIALLVAYIPDASQLGEPQRQHINRFLARETRRLGIPFVDVTPRIEAYPDARELYLFPLDAHTSPRGHEMIAQALFELLSREKLIAGD